MSHISVDFETFFSKKLKYGLRTHIAEEYCRHELFDCYLLSVCDGKNQWTGHPKDFNWSALDHQTLVSHNAYFDHTVYDELVRRKLAPQLTIPAWHCTANLTSYLCNRRALRQAGEHLFKLQVDKTYRDVADGKNWPQDYTPEEREHVVRAGRQDALLCWRLWDTFSGQWPHVEQRLSDITIEQGRRGVQIDVSRLNDYLMQTHEMKLSTEKVIPWMMEDESEDWDEFNCRPTSTKCIAEQCRRQKIPCAPVRSHDEDEYEEWETQYAPAHPWIRAMSAWRSLSKLYATFSRMKRRLRSDGTMPFALLYFGAHTGRWSGTAGINFQNMRKKPLFCNEAGLMEHDEKRITAAIDAKTATGKYPEWARYAIDFRALFIARPGKKMILSDLAQIEPRVLAWLGGNKPLLAAISGGMSVYEAFARTAMGYTGGPLTGAAKRTDYYKMLKIQVLGLGYGAGWEKFISIAQNEGGIDLCATDPEFVTREDPFTHETKQVPGYGTTSRDIVAKFRAASPHITGLWSALENNFRSSIGEDFVATLPSGRKMRYEGVRAAVKIEKDKETGKPRRKTEYTAGIGSIRKTFYGGKLAENVTQATARDVFGWQLVNMVDSCRWPCLFSAHDEAVLEVDRDVTARDVEHEMSKCPPWMPGLPVAAEAQEVLHYQK